VLIHATMMLPEWNSNLPCM